MRHHERAGGMEALRSASGSVAVLLVWWVTAAWAWAAAGESEMVLWYDKPAGAWVEALPIGNGHMGAMVFGGTGQERIQFNHDTLWAGGPEDYVHDGAAEALPEIRRLLFAGKQKEAERLATERFMSRPLRQVAYQPFGDLLIAMAGHEAAREYRRSLDLSTAIATTTYRVGDVRYTRQALASYPDGVIVVRIAAEAPGRVSLAARLTSPHAASSTARVDDRTLAVRGKVNDFKMRSEKEPIASVMRFEGRIRVIAEAGTVTTDDTGVTVTNADAVTIVLAAATNHVAYDDVSGDAAKRCAAALAAAADKTWPALRDAHVADHAALFDRVKLRLGDGGAAADVPTDQRLAAEKERHDPALAALAFQYGRYLLIASSRPGSQPANLQGVWNESLTPPWDSKYTVNINTEMNYWPAEIANLSECSEPLFAALSDMTRTGARTAKVHYNAGGWVLHHNFDLWRGTAPINGANHGIWPTGGAWLCQHLWWRYQFGGDERFLRERAYPIMKGAAEFFLDTLVEDPVHGKGWLVSGPSNSPEHGGLVMGPAMDHQIIRWLLNATADAADVLKVDADFARRCRQTAGRIAPDRVGSGGQLREWLYTEHYKTNHRHVSHLWALHPGEQITPETPELFAAARQTLVYRGDGGTGWSMAWKVNFRARLLEGDHALKMVRNLMQPAGRGGGLSPTLFDACPPFQIDGNFGLTSGVAEMLVQSHRRDEQGRYVIDLLPALPAAWASGSVQGLRVRGGGTVSITWRDGELVEHAITGPAAEPPPVRYRGAFIR